MLNRVKYDCSLISFSASWLVNSFFITANYLIYAVIVFNFIFFWFCSYSFLIFPNLFSYAATVFFAGINSA